MRLRLRLRWSILAVLAAGCTRFGESSARDAGAAPGPGTGDASSPCGSAGCSSLCRSIDAKLPSGVYELDPDGPGGVRPARLVYCEMATAGGGWTLAARSVAGGRADQSFGWYHDYGAPDDPTHPYSLAVGEIGLDVREILFGAYASGVTWAEPVYTEQLPAGFVETYRTRGYEVVGGAKTVLGGCAPPSGGPSFLRWVGRTDLSDQWFFRDNDDGPGFGLFPDGWNSNYAFISTADHCAAGADLGDKQAMIFVR